MTGSEQRRAEAEMAAKLFDGADLICHGYREGRLPGAFTAVKDSLEEDASGLPAPDIVLSPRVDDAHQDHRLLGRLATTVWRDALHLHYEIPKWDGDFAAATAYVAVPDDVARLKVAHLDAAYPSQHSRDWWDDELFLGIMRVRGMECRSRYAEAFSVSKSIIEMAVPDAGSAPTS
jgi:LmbE family N-acetylglucosaminyl deacetylase